MAKEHTKYYNSKNEEVPSTTTVLKLLNKNLDGWANSLGFRHINIQKYLEEKAALGTYIHSVSEKYFNPDMKPDVHPDSNFMSGRDYSELLYRLDYVNTYLSDIGYKPLYQEFIMSGERYGGTLDLLFYNEELNKYLLVDLKSSKGLYNTMYMQLMGYVQLLEELHGIHVDEVAILLILKDMDDEDFLKIYNTDTHFCQHYLEIFNQLLNIYYILDDEERSKIIK